MSRTSRLSNQLSFAAATFIALGASVALVWTSSYSAYSATTANPSDSWATGSVALSDDDSNGAMFTAVGLRPGSTGTRCIVVSSTGTLPAVVKLYGTSMSTTNALSSYIGLTITAGTGGSFGGGCGTFSPLSSGSAVYSGTLAALPTSYATGVGAWTVAGTTGPAETRTFQFTYTVDPAAPTSTQSSTATATFTWESQNS